MNCQFSYKSYRRTFVRPLDTAHGRWLEREGFIVRVEAEGRIGYGEVAPIPWFGTESMAQAREFLDRLETDAALAEDADKLDGLSCCAFGVSAALASLSAGLGGCSSNEVSRGHEGLRPDLKEPGTAALLPAGELALDALSGKLSRGHTVFKWKIGVNAFEKESAIFEELAAALPKGTNLRLDANGGLSEAVFVQWLELLACSGDVVEYLEQPLPVGKEAAMAEAMVRIGVPIALDESLNGPDGAKWLAPGAWAGPLVVKPLLMGSVDALVGRLQAVQEQVVLSSVFETGIGRANALGLLEVLPGVQYAVGFDTQEAFEDDLGDGDVWSVLNRNWIKGIRGEDLTKRIKARCQMLGALNTPERGILIAERDPVEFAVSFLAAVELKLPVILANPDWGALELAELRDLVSPAYCFGLEEVAFGSASVPLPEAAILIPTGGSTGGVKLAVHSWESLTAAARSLQAFLGGGPIDSCCVLPLYHVSGLMQLVRALVTGGSIRFDATEVAGACLSWVPTQLQRAVNGMATSLTKSGAVDTELVPALDQLTELRSARAIFVGGAAISDALAKQARAAGLPIVPVYGMTETAAMVAAQSADSFAGGESGAEVLPQVGIDIVDPNADGIGRIRIRSKSLFQGYWGAAALDLSEGYLTDDEGILSADGRLVVVGRVDRIIISGGEKVDPREVEAALLRMEGIEEAWVVGQEDPEWGQRVVAYCVGDFADAAQILAALKAGLASYKLPKEIFLVETLPLDAKGKLLR